MRIFRVSRLVIVLGLVSGPALADMRASISGGAPILPAAFTPLPQHWSAVEPPSPVMQQLVNPQQPPVPVSPPPPTATAASVAEKPDPKPAPIVPAPATPPSAPAAPGNTIVVWTRPLMNRQLSQAEKSAELAPDLLEAILRIESIYDPTRVDLIGEAPFMEVRPGTASMNNVFADRWHLADSDPNVHFRVRALAQAWMASDITDCNAFYKNRASDGGPALTALNAGDCARLAQLRADRDEPWTRMPIAVSASDLPVFAAPFPGMRLSKTDFWAAQKARIQAIQARLQNKWQAASAAQPH